MEKLKRIVALLLALLLAMGLWALAEDEEILVEDGVALSDDYMVEFGYDYSSPEEVALYLYAFMELPPNFLTKQEARDLGWRSSEGNLWKVAEGMSIGGDVFGNREGRLPDAKDRTWYECDVNYEGGFRGSDRVLFSTDGLIYYSDDHYKTFDLLYEGWYDPDFRYGEEEEEETGKWGNWSW